MTPKQYLAKILEQQTFDDDDQEVKNLRSRRKEIETLLRENFSTPSVRWAGSMAKGTMIRDSYDGDMTCYFPHDEEEAGSTLEEIYNCVAEVLKSKYSVDCKASALRTKDTSTISEKGFPEDLHIDVVPGRFTTDEKDDVFLHRNEGNKDRLKTNLQIHVDHIKDSGVTDAIRLMKLWKVRNGLNVKTFVLELLVVKLLEDQKNSGLSDQLEEVWRQFRDNPDGLAVKDPANPDGNDLKALLDEARAELSSVAATTLATIEAQGWEAVFGELDEADADDEDKKEALTAAAVHVRNPTKPWCQGA